MGGMHGIMLSVLIGLFLVTSGCGSHCLFCLIDSPIAHPRHYVFIQEKLSQLFEPVWSTTLHSTLLCLLGAGKSEHDPGRPQQQQPSLFTLPVVAPPKTHETFGRHGCVGLSRYDGANLCGRVLAGTIAHFIAASGHSREFGTDDGAGINIDASQQ